MVELHYTHVWFIQVKRISANREPFFLDGFNPYKILLWEVNFQAACIYISYLANKKGKRNNNYAKYTLQDAYKWISRRHILAELLDGKSVLHFVILSEIVSWGIVSHTLSPKNMAESFNQNLKYTPHIYQAHTTKQFRQTF